MSKLLELRAKSKVADTAETYIASVADTFAPSGDPLTFITSSGEALVFLSLTEQYLQRVEPGSNAYWTSGEATAFSSMVKYTQTLHQDYLHQARPRHPDQGDRRPDPHPLDGRPASRRRRLVTTTATAAALSRHTQPQAR